MSTVLTRIRPAVPQTILRLRTTNPYRAMSAYASAEKGDAPLFGLTERQPTDTEKAFLDDVLQLYQLKPTTTAYAHYDSKAVFHDPIGIAEGLDSIKSQFNGMPKIFSESFTKGIKVLDNPSVKPPSLQISLAQEYHFKPTGSKLVNSKITYTVDPSTNLITKHLEEWDGKPNLTAEDGFFGKLQEMRKKATASMIDATVKS